MHKQTALGVWGMSLPRTTLQANLLKWTSEMVSENVLDQNASCLLCLSYFALACIAPCKFICDSPV